MVKKPPASWTNSSLKTNVYLVNGSMYLNCDLAEEPYGIPGAYGFWKGEALIVIPFDNIERIETFDGED